MKKFFDVLMLKGLWKIKPIHVVMFWLLLVYQAWMGSPYFMYYVVGAPEPGTAPRYVGKLRVSGELQRTRDGWIPPRYFVQTPQGEVEFHCGYLPYKRECFPLGDDKRIEPEGLIVVGADPYWGVDYMKLPFKPVYAHRNDYFESLESKKNLRTLFLPAHRWSAIRFCLGAFVYMLAVMLSAWFSSSPRPRRPGDPPTEAEVAAKLLAEETAKASSIGALLLALPILSASALAGENVLPPGANPCEADWVNRSEFDTLRSLAELKYLESFAQRGEVGAQLRLGLVRSTRDGKWKAPADQSYNIDWLTKAVDKGSKSAGWELARLRVGRKEITQEEFLRAGMSAAEEEGNPWAATYLMQLTNGRWGSKSTPTDCYPPDAKDGKCAPEDVLPISSAAKWARIAAEGGNVAAQEWLCLASVDDGRTERGQPADKDAAAKWCMLAAHSPCSARFRLAFPKTSGETGNAEERKEGERWSKLRDRPWRSLHNRFFTPNN